MARIGKPANDKAIQLLPDWLRVDPKIERMIRVVEVDCDDLHPVGEEVCKAQRLLERVAIKTHGRSP